MRCAQNYGHTHIGRARAHYHHQCHSQIGFRLTVFKYIFFLLLLFYILCFVCFFFLIYFFSLCPLMPHIYVCIFAHSKLRFGTFAFGFSAYLPLSQNHRQRLTHREKLNMEKMKKTERKKDKKKRNNTCHESEQQQCNVVVRRRRIRPAFGRLETRPVCR